MRDGTLIDFYEAKLFVPRGHFAEELLLKGWKPEGQLNRLFEEFIRPGQTVLDIGANIGFHAVEIAARVGKGGKVFAVEADVENVMSLRQTITAGRLTNIYLLPVAAASQTGTIRMLSREGTNSTFSDAVEGDSPEIAVTVRLDEVINEHVDLIKIDIEGAELPAMRGLTGIIQRSRPLIITEFSRQYIERTLGADRGQEYLDFLWSQRYTFYYITPNGDLQPQSSVQMALETQEWARVSLGWGHIELLLLPAEVALESVRTPAAAWAGDHGETEPLPEPFKHNDMREVIAAAMQVARRCLFGRRTTLGSRREGL